MAKYNLCAKRKGTYSNTEFDDTPISHMDMMIL